MPPFPQPGARIDLAAPVQPIMLRFFGLGMPGSAVLAANAFFGSGFSVAFLLDVSGREVARRFSAPESSSAGMLLLALTASLAWTAWRRARTRSAWRRLPERT